MTKAPVKKERKKMPDKRKGNADISYYKDEALIRHVGGRLRDIRKSYGWTIKEVSEAAGVDTTQLGRMERGLTNFYISSLYRLAEVLEVPAKSLLP